MKKLGAFFIGLAATLGLTCLPCWVPVIMALNAVGMTWILAYGTSPFVIVLTIIGLALMVKGMRQKSCKIPKR